MIKSFSGVTRVEARRAFGCVTTPHCHCFAGGLDATATATMCCSTHLEHTIRGEIRSIWSGTGNFGGARSFPIAADLQRKNGRRGGKRAHGISDASQRRPPSSEEGIEYLVVYRLPAMEDSRRFAGDSRRLGIGISMTTLKARSEALWR